MMTTTQLNVYFDTEFTELQKNTELISIGMLTDNGDYFYAELSDYNKQNLNPWVLENVIPGLYYGETGGIVTYIDAGDKGKSLPVSNNLKEHPTKDDVLVYLTEWFDTISNGGAVKIKLISDVCHYDTLLLCDIFYGALNLPKNVSPACYDINQDIERAYRVSQLEAFNLSREKIAGVYNTTVKHNALMDAIIIRKCYLALNENK